MGAVDLAFAYFTARCAGRGLQLLSMLVLCLYTFRYSASFFASFFVQEVTTVATDTAHAAALRSTSSLAKARKQAQN